MSTPDDIEALRYAVEIQPKPRARNWTLVAVTADLGDAVYLADAHFAHDGERARVLDSEQPDDPIEYTTPIPRRSTR